MTIRERGNEWFMEFWMRLHQRGVTRRIIVGTRIVLLRFRMRPRRWRSWRHHRLVLGVGYFALSYAKLEQEFIKQAQMLAMSRGWAHGESDKTAEQEAFAQAASISLGDLKKAAVWAKQAHLMTADKALLLEVNRITSRMASLSPDRHGIMHYFAALEDADAIILPATYIRAHQWVKPDPKTELGQLKLKVPIIEHYTYGDLKRLDTEALSLADCIINLSDRLRQGFYCTKSEEKRQVTDA